MNDNMQSSNTTLKIGAPKGRFGKEETKLDDNTFEALLLDIACNKPINKIISGYKIGYSRLNNIKIKHSDEIDKKRCQIAITQSKQFIDDSIIKRGEILNSISEKDIKGAKLSAKTSAIVDLTNVKRLEAGQSTENVSIVSKELNDEQLREFIINGNVGVTSEK